MLQATEILFCDECEAATIRCERAWRAFLTLGPDGEPAIAVVCPVCAERKHGEDEAAWSD